MVVFYRLVFLWILSIGFVWIGISLTFKLTGPLRLLALCLAILGAAVFFYSPWLAARGLS